MEKERFHVLDGMRGIAAIVVMLTHYVPFMGHEILQNGYVAVDFFFVLSGFVLCHSYGESIQNGLPAYAFIGKRIARLYPMLLLGIGIGAPVFYLFAKEDYSPYLLSDIPKSILCNVFFIPFIKKGSIFPTDDPLWSLFFEMVASIAFIKLIRLEKRRLITIAAMCFSFIIFAEMLFVATHDNMALNYGFGWGANNFIAGFPRTFYSFICGILIYHSRDKMESRSQNSPFFIYFCLLCVLFSPLKANGIYYLCAIGCMTPALVKMGSQIKLSKQRDIWLAEVLGNISYPLYCIHFPVGHVFTMLGKHYHIANHVCLVGAVLLSVSLSIIAAKYYETPFRHYLTKCLAKRQ